MGWPDLTVGWPDGSGGWPSGSGGWPSGDIVVAELATWSATDKHANITLDATKLIATQAVNNTLVSLRASIGKSTGKYLFEIKKGIADSFVYIGFADSEASLNIQLGSNILVPASISVGHRLAAYYANNVTTSGTAPTNVTTPYLFAVDCDLGHGWIAKADAWAQGDPTTDTSPSFTWAPGTTIYPAASLNNVSTPDNTATLNAGQSPFANSTLAAACIAAGYKEGFGNFAAPDIEYIYGINGETRGYILDGVTTLYDTNLIDYNPGVKTWSPIAGASNSTGWISDESTVVTFNTLADHPYTVGDKYSVPYYPSGITSGVVTVSAIGNLPGVGDESVIYYTSSTVKWYRWITGAYVEVFGQGATLPHGTYTILSTPTLRKFTATPDAPYTRIITGNGNLDGYSACDIFRFILPSGMLYVGDRLNITGNAYFGVGSNSRTIKCLINDTSTAFTLTSSGSNLILPFSASIAITENSITGMESQNIILNPIRDVWIIQLASSKDILAASEAVAILNVKIDLLRN